MRFVSTRRSSRCRRLLLSSDKQEFYLEDVPELPWSLVAGKPSPTAIKDVIELPVVAPRSVSPASTTRSQRDFYCIGPPGCGKTLIGQATAFNLTAKLREKTGHDMKECFMHVKAPRFSTCGWANPRGWCRDLLPWPRGKRKQDTCRSCLLTRPNLSSQSTGGPVCEHPLDAGAMFCSEMDGIESSTTWSLFSPRIG